VVAIWVVEVDIAAVGAVGTPDNAVPDTVEV
jgi:hypothetical protein